MQPLVIPGLLSPAEVAEANRLMDTAEYDDGRATAAGAAHAVKANRQVSRRSAAAPALDAVVDAALRRCQPFREALSPSAVSQVIYARYGVSDGYGRHVDAVMTGMPPMRADVSLTIFLSDPAAYDGGELRLCHGLADHTDFKLAAGAAVAYPTTLLHEVRPVAQGERRVAVLWVQSFYRDPEIRQLVADLRRCLTHAKTAPGGVAVELSQVLANLERKFVGT